MSSVNKVMVLGNLGADPEIRFTQNGTASANFRMACTESWTDKNSGQKQERTEWVRVVVWGKLAELCGEYLKKGRQAFVEGRLQTREWQDKDGQKRFTTEVVASQVVFIGGGRGEQRSQGYGGNATSGHAGNHDAGGASYGSWDDVPTSKPNDDIPF